MPEFAFQPERLVDLESDDDLGDGAYLQCWRRPVLMPGGAHGIAGRLANCDTGTD